MSSFSKQMAFYTAYHQDHTNIWIHVAGVPLITFTAFIPLHWLGLFELGGLPVTGAVLLYLYSVQYYLRTDLLFGSVATLLYGALLVAAWQVAQMGLMTGMLVFLAGQIVGWTAQIWGHLHFERNRPAFLENIYQSFISAPLFVIADVFFHFGIKADLHREIQAELAATGRLRESPPQGQTAQG